MGDLWIEDEWDFTEVTVGVWRLEKLLHRGGWTVGPGAAAAALAAARSADAGAWRTACLRFVHGRPVLPPGGMGCPRHRPQPRGPLVDILRNDWFDVAGISASCEKNMDTLQSTVQDIRKVSRNRSIRIIVGGQWFAEHPEHVAALGADALGGDARQTVELAERLVRVAARHA
jgi:hypothetical protein